MQRYKKMEITTELEAIKYLVIAILIGMLVIVLSVILMLNMFYLGVLRINEKYSDKASGCLLKII